MTHYLKSLIRVTGGKSGIPRLNPEKAEDMSSNIREIINPTMSVPIGKKKVLSNLSNKSSVRKNDSVQMYADIPLSSLNRKKDIRKRPSGKQYAEDELTDVILRV